MRAAVCRPGSDLFRMEDLTIEDPRPDEVLVRFTATGLCHTDLEVAAGFMPTPFPVVAGHEGAGVVEAVGSAVTGFARATAWWPASVSAEAAEIASAASPRTAPTTSH